MPINNPVAAKFVGIGLPNQAKVTELGILPNQSRLVAWDIPDTSLIRQVEVTAPARVRVYRSQSARDADANRGLNSEMLPGRGLLLEVVTTTANEAIALSPVVWAVRDGDYFYGLVTNLGTVAADIEVALNFIGQEQS